MTDPRRFVLLSLTALSGMGGCLLSPAHAAAADSEVIELRREMAEMRRDAEISQKGCASG